MKTKTIHLKLKRGRNVHGTDTYMVLSMTNAISVHVTDPAQIVHVGDLLTEGQAQSLVDLRCYEIATVSSYYQ